MPSTISTMWLLLAAVIVAGVDGSDGETDIDIHRDFRKTAPSNSHTCGDDYNDVEYKMFGAFGEDNCVLLRNEGYRLLSCAVEIGSFNASATFEDDGRESYVYGRLEVSYESFWTGLTSKRIDFYPLDDSRSNCLVAMSEMFEFIAHYIDIATPCEDQHNEVTEALNAAFGEANCYTTLETEEGVEYGYYQCGGIDWSISGLHQDEFYNVDTRGTYKYLPDDTEKPVFLTVGYVAEGWEEVLESTDFFAFCLRDFSRVLSKIEQRPDLTVIEECSEDHDYVLGRINAAFGEESCASLLANDRESTTYHCQTNVEYLVEGDAMILFDASANYTYLPPDYTYLPQHRNHKRILEIQYGDVLLGRKSQATDFRLPNCINGFENAFKTIQGFASCQDKHDAIIGALNGAFGEENCWRSSTNESGQIIETYGCDYLVDWYGFDGGSADARGTYQYLPDDNDKPKHLSVSRKRDGFERWHWETDFSPSSSCLDDFSGLFSLIEEDSKCREDHEYVLDQIRIAFGAERCTSRLEDGTNYVTYSCQITVQDFEASAEYYYLPEDQQQRRTLRTQYGSDSMETQSLVTNFRTGSTGFYCIGDFTGAFKTIRGYSFDGCNDSNSDILSKLIAAFGDERCDTVITESLHIFEERQWLECTSDVQGFYAYAKYEYDAIDKNQPRALEVSYGDNNSSAQKISSNLSTSSGCLIKFEDAFESITDGFATSSGCNEKSEDIMEALHAAFGEENCSPSSMYYNDGQLFARYGCGVDFGDFLSARVSYGYLPDNNDMPYSLQVSYRAYADGGMFLYEEDKSTDFSSSCLDDFGGILSYIKQRIITFFKQEGKCREAHGYVLTAMNVAFGEENCSALPTADSDSETYSCQVSSGGFDASAEYNYIRSSEYEPRNLQIQYEEIGMDATSLATNFTSTCLNDNEFVGAFRTIRGYTFDGCNEAHSDIVDKLTATFGNERCGEYGIMDVVYGIEYGLETQRGIVCETRDIQGFYAYAEYTFDEYDKNQPKTLYVNHRGAEGVSTDLSNSGGCLINFADMFETIGNEIAVNICTNSDQPVLMFTPKYGERKETSCKILGKRKKPRKLKRLCRGDQELSRMCPGLCRMKSECKCYNNPYEFKAKDVEGNKTKITCDALMGMSVAERKILCNKRKIKYNCPGICKQRCASSVWNESDGDKVVL